MSNNKHINKNDIKYKIIKDPLYDYIQIEPDVCQMIIDNKYFQRLRRIEQTSMRCLYPSARHDRFVHSLGTYHLAKMAVEAINQNDVIIGDYDQDFVTKLNEYGDTDVNINEKAKKKYLLNISNRECLNFSFEMAALLHDVGHSPFSHTLEQFFKFYYKKTFGEVSEEKILDIFFEEIARCIEETEEDFATFQEECKNANASPHEIVSCIIAIKCFKNALDELAKKSSRGGGVDYCFLTRCILGAQYTDKKNSNDYKNCLIKLLNSTIDVDKLDYISRDSKISGFHNTNIDTSRLIKSFALALNKVENDDYELCLVFNKTGISVIENVILSRNALHRWIYSHHKVKYESDLLVKSINSIALNNKREKDNKKNTDGLFISEYFSVASILDKLVCDDSIWSLLMENKDKVNEIEELFDRSKQKLAIWKSYAEFQAYFNSDKNACAVGEFDFKQMINYFGSGSGDEKKIEKFEEYLKEFEQFKNHKNDNEPDSEYKLTVVICDTSFACIKPDSILVYINNKLYSFDRILPEMKNNSDNTKFFYVYGSKKIKKILNDENYKYKDEFIEYIKKFEGFKFKQKM